MAIHKNGAAYSTGRLLGSRVPVYRHHGKLLTGIFGLLLLIAIIYLLLSIAEIAFQKIGFTRVQFAIILVVSFVGSVVNIPLFRVRSTEPAVEVQEVRAFWVTYRVPRLVFENVSTLVAINVGGAVVPIIVSIYLLSRNPSSWGVALAGTLVTALLVHLVARKKKGVGIVTPALIPPAIAALVAYLLVPTSPVVTAYVSGTMGTLIGADLTNLGGIGKLGAPLASIGGGGQFDGIFLTGIMAVLLAILL
jgi:uncharacterized membrane protein